MLETNRLWKAITALVVSFLLGAKLLAFPAYAVTLPSFPACANPQGTLIAKYDNGSHGIAGLGEKTGSDAVYQLSSETVTQCFCGTDGKGIQTNWVVESTLSADDVKVLLSSGWVQIVDGSAWGLDPVSYLTNNIDFSCPGNNDGSNSNSSGSTSSSQGDISTPGLVAASVLTLANTGNVQTIVALLSFGSVCLLSGLLLRKKNSQ